MLLLSRGKKTGGGVAILHRSSLRMTQQNTEEHKSFEFMEVLFKAGNHTIRLGVVYRPPSSSVSLFLDELTTYFDHHMTTSGELILVGDFNL